MPKRIFIVHGWGGNPEEGWYSWLKKELETRGFEVTAPAMPDTENPKIEAWVSFLEKNVGVAKQDTYFIGHSIGCQTILRYLERLPEDVKIGGAVFVAGWLDLQNLETEEEIRIAKRWTENQIDFEKVKKHTENFVAIFSDNDHWVSLEKNKKLFSEKLGAKIIIEKQKGHFAGEDGLKELPVVLENILALAA